MTHHRVPLLARVLVRELSTGPGPVPIAVALLTPYCDPSRALDAVRHAVTRGDLTEHPGNDGPTTLAATGGHRRTYSPPRR